MNAYKHEKANRSLEKSYLPAKSTFIYSKFCITEGSCVPYIQRDNFGIKILCSTHHYLTLKSNLR